MCSTTRNLSERIDARCHRCCASERDAVKKTSLPDRSSDNPQLRSRVGFRTLTLLNATFRAVREIADIFALLPSPNLHDQRISTRFVHRITPRLRADAHSFSP